MTQAWIKELYVAERQLSLTLPHPFIHVIRCTHYASSVYPRHPLYSTLSAVLHVISSLCPIRLSTSSVVLHIILDVHKNHFKKASCE
jgi:hypothetical protein